MREQTSHTESEDSIPILWVAYGQNQSQSPDELFAVLPDFSMESQLNRLNAYNKDTENFQFGSFTVCHLISINS